MVFQKVDLNGSKLTCPTLLLVDQSSPNISPNARGIAVDHVFPILDISIISRDICNQSLKLSETVPNFARFWPSNFFFRTARHYEIEHTSDHVAKFHDNQPTKFGVITLKKEKKRNSSKTR